MNIRQLKEFIATLDPEAEVKIVQGGDCSELKLLEYDENAWGGISFWVAEKFEKCTDDAEHDPFYEGDEATSIANECMFFKKQAE